MTHRELFLSLLDFSDLPVLMFLLKPKWFWACQMDEVVNLQTEFMLNIEFKSR